MQNADVSTVQIAGDRALSISDIRGKESFVQVPLKIVDLFCGCGGFSLGAEAAGLPPTLAFDIDPILTSSYERNHPGTKLVLSDVGKVSGADILRDSGGPISGLFGGPPCQAFSSIGHRNLNDPRRTLLGHFFRLVKELTPAFFIMENVRGLSYTDAKPELDNALELIPPNYRILGPLVLDAGKYGAATKRQRLFVVGYDPSIVDALTAFDIEQKREPTVTVEDAISDLVNAENVGSDNGFDVWKAFQRKQISAYAKKLRQSDHSFTGHKRTAHSDEVVSRFMKVVPGTTEQIGRHPRLQWGGQCPTLRAGTGSDRGSYQSVRPIHPAEPRVITVREAARLQGFPDRFRFHPTIWHSFRMIGNSVSPPVSKMLFELIAERMDTGSFLKQAAE